MPQHPTIDVVNLPTQGWEIEGERLYLGDHFEVWATESFINPITRPAPIEAADQWAFELELEFSKRGVIVKRIGAIAEGVEDWIVDDYLYVGEWQLLAVSPNLGEIADDGEVTLGLVQGVGGGGGGKLLAAVIAATVGLLAIGWVVTEVRLTLREALPDEPSRRGLLDIGKLLAVAAFGFVVFLLLGRIPK